jgi:hypothetical protein
MGVFARMMEGLASEGTEQKTIMIDATYLKAHRILRVCGRKRGTPSPRASAHVTDHSFER